MRNILMYLEQSATLFPDKIAIVDEQKQCTYQELLNNSKALGSRIAMDTTARKPVIVFMEKSVEALTTFMAIAQAGCFYVYINPEQPMNRVLQIIETSQSDLVICASALMHRFDHVAFDGTLLEYESLTDLEIDEKKLNAIRESAVDGDPLYCNFTSGSTGIPKGVVISHRAVSDFIDVFTETFAISEEDVIANQAPFDFDVSVKDIYSAFKVGATIALIPSTYFFLVMKLMDFLEAKKVTTMIWAVSALCYVNQLKGLTYKIPKTVNKVMFSGEVMPIKHLLAWQQALPNASFVNLYGPTEITCNCTYFRIERKYALDEKIPIGIPFENKKIILLNDHDEEVTKPNECGEICVAGSTLALGYLNDPERTAQAFVQNPIHNHYREIIYRTGDLGYYDEKNNLYFAGRKDFQIKYMGHRIELEEVESKMNTLKEVERACCLFEKERIVAYYQGDIEGKELKKKLKEVMPFYMIPTIFHQLDALPLNKNGKLDRKSLAMKEVS